CSRRWALPKKPGRWAERAELVSSEAGFFMLLKCKRLGFIPTVGGLMFLWLLLLTVFVTAGWFPSVSYSQQVRISYSGVSGQNLPFWVTYEAGLYKKYGLDAEMVLISGGLANLEALLANEIAFTYLGGASPIQATVQGADVVILA